jgi:hypothetical protein
LAGIALAKRVMAPRRRVGFREAITRRIRATGVQAHGLGVGVSV